MELYLVTYDVPGDKRRTKIADVLEDYGQRVQYSVFEVWLDAGRLPELLARLNALVDSSHDSVRVYRLCKPYQERVIILGRDSAPEPPGLIII